MSQLTDNVKQQEAQIIGQALMQMRAQIETLELIHFQTSEHPVNGLADDFRKFHAVLVGAERKHHEYLASIAPKPVLGPVASASNISEFPQPDPTPEGEAT